MTDDELKGHFDAMRQDIGATIRKETDAIRAENAAAHAETRRHFEVVMEATRPEIRLIAESVSMVNEKLDRAVAELHEKIDRTASEMQALVKFSYDELGRRVKVLEKK